MQRLKNALRDRRGETIVEVLVAFVLLMLFLALFTASLRFAGGPRPRHRPPAITPTCLPKHFTRSTTMRPSGKRTGTKTRMSFSRGDRTVFAVEDVEIQTIQAKIKDDNDEAAATHTFTRYYKKWTKIKTTQKRTRPHDHPAEQQKRYYPRGADGLPGAAGTVWHGGGHAGQACAEAYIEVQQLTRAQNLADALTETIRGELADADGTISIVNAATESDADSADADSANNIFIEDARLTEGTALRFTVESSYTGDT